jgi:energy-coupling factor transporter ATP-binding protein EcfA2
MYFYILKEKVHGDEVEVVRIDISVIKNMKHSYVNIYASDFTHLENTFNVINKYKITNVDKVVNIDQIIQQGNSLGNNNFTIEYDELEVVKDYYPYLNTDLLFERYLMSDESILLLTGEPGVGKSKLVSLMFKYILENFDKVEKYLNKSQFDLDDEESLNVTYVKNEEILGTDQFWSMLSKTDSSIVFLDDADNSLLPRKNLSDISSQADMDRNKFINNLLSFTDGVYKNNIKFIITTNRDVTKLDPAALRKGRTFDILNLRNLKYEEAKKIWLDNDLSIELFEKEYNGEETISSADLGSTISQLLKSTENGVSTDSYCLEDNISIYHKTKNNGKRNKIKF